MSTFLLLFGTFIGYIIMYRLYGNFIGKKIFKISLQNKAPSTQFEDGLDYVPTKKEVIFGHHYTSIAGTGPIVGPAIAVIWGWLPAVLWVFFGSIFIGALHDFGALIISMRNNGTSISDYASKYIGKRAKNLLFGIVFLELWIVIAIFGLVIAIIFSIYPSSVFPIWFQIPIAVILGHLAYKKGKNIQILSIFALLIMYGSIFVGYYWQLKMPSIFGIPATGVWTIVLLVYAFIASVLPVTTLLQPRDYINAYQLIVAMGLMVLGIIASVLMKGMEIVAPPINFHPENAPSMWPFLFITVACGAVSGFHALVSSGTSSKQVKNEEDALFIGYGSMIMEGVLAILVIIAVTAGVGLGYKGLVGSEAWLSHYSSWDKAEGLGANLGAFVFGSSNMIKTLGIPEWIAITIMGVFVASFASTTLDSATRIQRYVVSEAFEGTKLKIFTNRYVATFFVILTASILAFATGADGKGALRLWPLFGAVNQTLAALALIVVTIYLKKSGGKKWILAGVPAIFMTVVTIWAVIENQITFIKKSEYLLIVVNSIVIFILFFVVLDGVIHFFKSNKEIL